MSLAERTKAAGRGREDGLKEGKKRTTLMNYGKVLGVRAQAVTGKDALPQL